MVQAIKFYADWCGPCKMLGPVMERSGLPYQKVNVDNDQELSTKYGIRNVPTLVKVSAICLFCYTYS